MESGEVLTLLGPNGAGKTTLLLTLAGLLPAQDGTVAVDGTELKNGRPSLANSAGVILVPDDRCLFTTLAVEENLKVAARKGGPQPRDMLEIFPALEKRWELKAGALSGGEQQMLAMARALIQEPKVLLVDEMSMGLAPLVVESLFEAVRRIAAEHGCAVVLVEQHVSLGPRRGRPGRRAEPRLDRAATAADGAARRRPPRAGLLRRRFQPACDASEVAAAARHAGVRASPADAQKSRSARGRPSYDYFAERVTISPPTSSMICLHRGELPGARRRGILLILLC